MGGRGGETRGPGAGLGGGDRYVSFLHTVLGLFDDGRYPRRKDNGRPLVPPAHREFAKAQENRPLSLYVVAAALTVERFRLSISRRFTYLQPAFGPGAPRRGVICGPCLDEKSAARYARVIFISTLSEVYKGSAAFLKGLSLTLGSPRLTLIPFGQREKDYIDPTGSVIVPRRLIEDTPREIVP
jgi:hypothetical protein